MSPTPVFPVALAISAAAVAVVVVLVAIIWLVSRQLGAGSARYGDTAAPGRHESYDDLDQLHVDLTGVPAEAADLARHPRSRDLHIRERKPLHSSADPEKAPVARVNKPARAETATALGPAGPADSAGPAGLTSPHDFTDPDDVDPAAADLSEGPSVRIPDLPPGSNTTGRLPDTGARGDAVTDLHAAVAAGDAAAAAAVGVHHPEVAWSAYLLAASLHPNPNQAEHLGRAYDAAPDGSCPTDEPSALADLRNELRLSFPLPDHHALVEVPCDADGLVAGWAATTLTFDPDAVHTALELRHLSDPSALTTILLADAAIHTLPPAPLPPLPRRSDAWGLLHLQAQVQHLMTSHDPSDLAAADLAAEAARDLLAHLSEPDPAARPHALGLLGDPNGGAPEAADTVELSIDYAAFEEELTYTQATIALAAGDRPRALRLVARLNAHPDKAHLMALVNRP